MINRLRLYDPDFDDLKMPNLDLSALQEKRATSVECDKHGDLHILQKRDGITHVISLDNRELILLLSAIKRLKG